MHISFKRQLGLEAGGLHLKMPYHMLKFSSVKGEKNPKKGACLIQFVKV